MKTVHYYFILKHSQKDSNIMPERNQIYDLLVNHVQVIGIYKLV